MLKLIHFKQMIQYDSKKTLVSVLLIFFLNSNLAPNLVEFY